MTHAPWACVDKSLVVTIVFVTQVLTAGFSVSFGTYYLPLLETFGSSRALTSWIGSLNYGVLCLSGPLVSMVIQRWGCRVAMMVGGVMSFIGLVTSSFVTNIYVMYLTYGIITGLGHGFSFATGIVTITLYFEKYRAFVMGLTLSGVGIGGFINPLLNQTLIDMFNWRGALLLYSALTLNVCAGSLALGRVVTPGGHDVRNVKRKSLLRSFAVWILFLNCVLFCFGMNILFLHLAPYVVLRGYDKYVAAVALSSLGVANVLGRIFLGYISNKPGVNVILLFSGSYVIAGISVIAISLWNNLYFIISCSVAFGLFSAAYGPVLSEVTCLLVGVSDFSRAYGVLMVAMGTGAILGPPAAGWLVDSTGYYPGVFYLSGGSVTAAGLLVLILLCRGRRNKNASRTLEIKQGQLLVYEDIKKSYVPSTKELASSV